MSNSDDFVSFEKALRDLQMRSEELKKLVSEGEIRAFRDGDSMKFRSEDVDALLSKSDGEEELSFADSLEDDTGMVTEELSDEDTLLADDDDIVVPERPSRSPRRGSARPARSAPVAADASAEREPAWVTAAAIIGCILCIWAAMIGFSVISGDGPADSPFTSLFEQQ